VGFHAWVNVDNFVNALAFCVTNDAPMRVIVQSSSPWSCSHADGVVTVNGSSHIKVADAGADKHGLSTRHNRVVQVTSGNVVGYCAFDGDATLTVSVFGDGTFEAKFGPDYGDGAVYGPIAGLAPPKAKSVLLEALVRKYAPIYMLNADEVYWQTNVDAFLPHMIMQTADHWRDGQGVNQTSLNDFYTGPLDRNVLARKAIDLGAKNTNSTACLRTRADLNHPSDTQDWFSGTRPQEASQLTTYAVVVEGKNGYLDIVYWWFFNYNQGKTVASTSWGNHASDWEHVKVHLGNVDFEQPQRETLLSVMYDHHGDTETHVPGDGVIELSGRQVLVHLANGDHEAYPRAGVYDRPMNTHDYCRDNAYRFDTRAGQVEIYAWNGGDFDAPPAGAPASFPDPGWLRYRGRWGNSQRGDLFGQVARLESGPEGIFRPGGYEIPG
jgi:hypothetical protein